MKIRFIILAFLLALAGCGGGGASATLPIAPSTAYGILGVSEYKSENTVIKTTLVPNADFLDRVATFWGLGNISPMIPAFDGNGLLMASWTPSNNPNAPTFVIAHGGGGIDATAFVLGANLRNMTGANILIVDSIWSRGRKTNGGDSIPINGPTLSSNVRMFDLVAAGRWLVTQGTDTKKTYAVGMSQGGWGVLRAFTNDPMVTQLVKPLYAGGVSLYPMCEEPGTPHTEPNNFTYHKLGPYHSRVLLITGALDTLTPVSYCSDSTLKSVEKWLHWEDATHAFNQQIGGAFTRTIDGVCQTMVNGFGSHQFCYNDRRVKQMLNEVNTFYSAVQQ